MKKSRTDVAVVGGGAAGMLAASEAAGMGLSVVLVEQNERLGVKLRITGKGRCNVTNDCDAAEVMRHIPRNAKFLYSALQRFGPADAKALFEGLGVPLKTERGGRVFPVSDRAADIAEALARRCDAAGVTRLHARVTGLTAESGRITGAETTAGPLACDALILCTGGMSYPKTGSRGDGYRLAAALGHSIVSPCASLVPLESDDAACAQMQGLSLRNVVLRLERGGKTLYESLGEMQFTHFGLSGPLVLSASAHIDGDPANCRIHLDLKPGLDAQKLDARLLSDFAKYSNRAFKNALGDLAPRLLIPVLVARSGIPAEQKVHEITREQRRVLGTILKDFSISLRAKRPVDEAIVTRGGVDTREVSPSDMSSKLVQGLYFAGEVLDLDAYTGGFNLQIAWSTAVAAGRGVRL